jgi:hypothetical protein
VTGGPGHVGDDVVGPVAEATPAAVVGVELAECALLLQAAAISPTARTTMRMNP